MTLTVTDTTGTEREVNETEWRDITESEEVAWYTGHAFIPESDVIECMGGRTLIRRKASQ